MPLRPVIRTAIEEAGPADYRAMADIHERGFHRAWSMEEIAALLADYPRVQGLVLRKAAPENHRPAGFGIVRVAGGEAEVLTVAVDPDNRRRGYGRLLVEEMARRAYRERAEALFLEVDESNRAAVMLYRQLGFVKVGERPRYYEHKDAPPGAALVMRLRLRKSA